MYRAKKLNGISKGLDKFQHTDLLIKCWIAFEAFCGKYQKDYVRDKISEFCDEFGDDFSNEYEKLSDILRDSLNKLKDLPVKDMRLSHINDDPKQISDVKNMGSVFSVIYQVRNNLFHGDKNPSGDKDDSEKIMLSAIALYSILERYLMKEGYSW